MKIRKAVSAVRAECQMTMKTALFSVPGKTAALMTAGVGIKEGQLAPSSPHS